MAAAQKEYRLLWTLAVALGNNFDSTFQNAAKQLELLNQKQKELAKSQKDAAALNKSANNIPDLYNHIESLRNRMSDLIVMYNNGDITQKQYMKTMGSLEREVSKYEQKIADEIAKIDERKRALEEAGYDTKHYTEILAQLAKEEEELKQRQKELNDEMIGSKTAIEMAEEAITSLGLADKLKEVANAYRECVMVAADFQESMSTVKALSGANSAEMEQLTQRAKDLGAATKFTALEVGDAMGYMGMAGWSAEEMLSGIDGVMNLAAASGEDLAMVSDIITDNLTAFRLEASDTARFVDVLAAAATNSNTNVAIMGETFKNSASIAGALGYTIEDMAVAVGTMANAGIKGSIAGTSLRNIFNGLLKDVTLSSEAFGEHTISVVNSDGSMKSFRETLAELRTEFEMMSESEKVMNAKELGGMRGYNGLLALVNATDEELDSLTTKINSSAGAAQKMADIRLDNLNGDLTIMQSAWDAIKTTLGEEFNSELRELVQTFTSILHTVNELIIANPELTKGIIAAVGAFLSITTAITTASAAMNAFKLVTSLLVPGLREIIVASAVIAGITGALVAFREAGNGTEREMSKLTATARVQYAEMNRLDAEYKKLADSEGEDYKNVAIARRELEKQTDAFNDAKVTADSFYSSHQKLVDSHDKIMDSYINNTREVYTQTASVEGLRERLERLVDENGNLVGSSTELNSVINMLNESVPGLGLAYDANTNSINKTTDAIRAQTKAEIDKKKYEANLETYQELLRESAALEENESASAAELTARQNELNTARANGIALSEGDPNTINMYFDEERAVLKAADAHKADAAALDENRQKIAELEIQLSEYENLYNGSNGDSAEGAIGGMSKQLMELSKHYQEAYDAAWRSITGQNALWDEAGETQAMDIDSINKNIKDQAVYWGEYNTNLEKLRELSNNEEYAGLSNVIASFADGSEDSVNAIAGLAKAADTDGSKLQELVTNYTDLITKQQETSDSIAQFSTDFDRESQRILQSAEDTVRGMNLSDEAAASAKATLNAYVREFYSEDFGTKIYNAAAGLRTHLMRGLNVANKAYNDENFYASGTSSASPGLAMVGENGPELVMMNGGERVLNHGDTVRVLRDGAAASNNSVSVSFNIGGNADTNTVAQLQAYADDFAERVMDVINSASADSARRAYA